MRLWSLHPKYLDAKGIVAVWREGLLAQKVLRGLTKGYRNHPQLDRFKASPDPIAAIASYLDEIAAEATNRNYQFDNSKLMPQRTRKKIAVTRGQVLYEWEHLKAKLAKRDPEKLAKIKNIREPEVHPLFKIVEGDIEPWEKIE